MSNRPHHTHLSATAPELSATPPEVSLLLRAHAEQHWLSREVVPVAVQLETREELPEEQVGAALAYLEVVWSEASRRAGDTDGAATRLDLALPAVADRLLAARARRYRAAVVVLRETALARVGSLLEVSYYSCVADGESASADGGSASADGESAGAVGEPSSRFSR